MGSFIYFVNFSFFSPSLCLICTLSPAENSPNKAFTAVLCVEFKEVCLSVWRKGMCALGVTMWVLGISTQCS